MPMLYVLGAALIVTLTACVVVPALPVLPVLLIIFIVFMLTWQTFALAIDLVKFVPVLFGPGPRMTNEEVMAVAADALANKGINHAIGLVNRQRTDGRLTWIVVTLTIGAGSTVHIDDATGEASVRHWGIR